MAWEVSGTDEFADWFGQLEDPKQDAVIAVVEILQQTGPTLGRPLADRIKGSNLHNLKELRPRGEGKTLRILFLFDPDQEAILLVGGDKSGQWSKWYTKAIPLAEKLYDKYLNQ